MKEVYIKDGPFIKTDNSGGKIANNILIALIPLIIYAFYKNGILLYIDNKVSVLKMFFPLIFVLISIISYFTSEYLYTLLFVKNGKNNILTFKNSLLAGTIFALFLPINTPLWLIAAAAFMASIIGRVIFSIFGSNKINISLVGNLIVVLVLSFVLKEYSYLNAAETTFENSPLFNFKTIGTVGTYDSLVKPYGSLWNFLFGSVPGAIGVTSAFLSILGYLYLVYKKAIKWRIPLVYLGTVLVMTYIIGLLNNIGFWYPLFHLLTGGLVFGSIYLASDYSTSPTTPVAQVIYAIFLGILTTIFRYTMFAPESVILSILIMNLFVKPIDYIGAMARFGLKKSAILILFQIIIVLGVSIYIAEAKANKITDSSNSIVN